MRYTMTAAVGTVILAGSALASVSPDEIFNIEIWYAGEVWSSSDAPGSITDFFLDEDGIWQVGGAWSTDNWASDWQFQIDQGDLAVEQTRGAGQSSFVVSSFNFTNNTGDDAAEFQLMVTANVAPLSAPTTMTGSLSGSLGSGNPLVEDATLTVPAGDFLYTAMVDGTGVRTLVDDSFSLTTNLTAPLGSFDFAGEPGPSVASTLGIRHSFGLTDGDNVNFVGAFVVTEIPAPGPVAVFGLAGLTATRRRR